MLDFFLVLIILIFLFLMIMKFFADFKKNYGRGYGYVPRDFERDKSMEALLDKSRGKMYWGGVTDRDAETLRKIYPNFNWEETLDRTRWLEGKEQERDILRREMARQSYQLQKREKLHQLKEKEKKTRKLQSPVQ